MPRILITGCSTGFGLATAQRFLAEGWEVIATMRNPSEDILPAQEGLTVLPLDVTDADSIAAAVAQAGPLDALVNNAGVGMLNVVEGAAMENTREVFETNILGPIALTKAVMPQFRERGEGVIVNVSSSVTVKPLPALSAYSASKAALNAFTESFALEAALFGVRVRLVLPGSSPTTSFGQNVVARMGMEIPAPYEAFVMDYLGELRGSSEVTVADDVAEAVWRAVTDPDTPMKTPAGADAVAWFHKADLPVE
ncbi:SDR family oxidoreductase [Aquicoccus porphyridii]|uniref:SDR family oxidoreductase n=1 Tax=Aquicoccus porphyridii TaxID=1852029 RepID=A0A5A9ZCQ6_9RHOB|nr:SDR family oxidoreductase [Aquicoccus porphyridii]KAA0914973.1 SDR family oxidoreductase [Aquicoccus porphyridii]RAI52483.1 short-chain dehydrogenase/reductase [Rhodobacteraceae bacterium AsT-22]